MTYADNVIRDLNWRNQARCEMQTMLDELLHVSEVENVCVFNNASTDFSINTDPPVTCISSVFSYKGENVKDFSIFPVFVGMTSDVSSTSIVHLRNFTEEFLDWLRKYRSEGMLKYTQNTRNFDEPILMFSIEFRNRQNDKIEQKVKAYSVQTNGMIIDYLTNMLSYQYPNIEWFN